jgi:hypothetical protein
MAKKLCTRCGRRPSLSGERYCPWCRQDIIAEMRDSGYLQSVMQYDKSRLRTGEMRENIEETKHGPRRG